MIIEWGREKEYADKLKKIYFPIPFPNNVFCINLTSKNDDLTGGGVDNSSPLVGNDITNFYFTANTDGFPYTERQDEFYWFAIGY